MNAFPRATEHSGIRSRLSARIKLVGAAVFVFSSMMPIYIPQSASSAGPDDYLASSQFLLVEEGFVMKTSSVTEQGYRIAYGKGIAHQVGSGESLFSIADLYNINPATIEWANDLEEGETIHPGETLTILPVDGVLHTVTRGQNVTKIASLYGVPAENILAQNQLEDSRIISGQQIIVPGGEPLLKERIAVVPTAVAPGRGDIVGEPPRPTQPPSGDAPESFGILQKPCDCVYTQYYHSSHYAVDMTKGKNAPIFAAEDGIVTRAEYGWNGGYGNVIVIDHGNGLQTLYAHNNELHIREGQAVMRGDVISSMGNTGKVYGATGIHLHFEVILNGVKKNPLLYLQ